MRSLAVLLASEAPEAGAVATFGAGAGVGTGADDVEVPARLCLAGDGAADCEQATETIRSKTIARAIDSRFISNLP